MAKKQVSFSFKIMLFILLFVIIAISVVTFIAASQMRQAIEQQTDSSADFQLKYTVSEIEKFIAKREEVMNTLAISHEVLEVDKEKLAPMLIHILKNDPMLTSVYFVSSLDGSIFLYQNVDGVYEEWVAPDSLDFRERSWYQNSLQSDKAVFTDPYVDVVTEKLVVTASRIVKDENGLAIGAVGADILIDSVANSINTMKFGHTGYALMFDNTGTIMAHAIKDGIGQNVAQFQPELKDVVAQMLSGKSGRQNIKLSHIRNIIYYNSLPELGWGIALLIPEKEYNASFTKTIYLVLIYSLITLVLISVLIRILIKRFTGPLLNVVENLNDIAQGEGDLTKRINIKSRDEISQAADAFNLFSDKLLNMIKDISAISTNVDDNTHQLLEALQQQANATNQVAYTIGEVAKGISDTSVNLSKTDTAVHVLAEAIDQINQGIGESTLSVENTASLSNEMTHSLLGAEDTFNYIHDISEANVSSAVNGKTSVLEVVNAMKHIENGIKEALKSVASLEKDSRAVEAIVKIINEISDQINLLSLNAAIEAARAGEHGLGFAVVAEEIRVLANKTRQSTNEISNIIDHISTSINDASQAVEKTSGQIGKGLNVTNNAAQLLEEIARSAENVRSSVIELKATTNAISKNSATVNEAMNALKTIIVNSSKASEEIFVNSKEVEQAIGSIAKISTDNAVSSEEVAASIEEQSANLEEMAAGANIIAEQVSKLKSLVDKFKIE